jgi:hypothetical protein
MAPPRRARRATFSVREFLAGAGQWLFALVVIGIFVLVFLIQASMITLPVWAEAWDQVSPDLRNEYAAVMFSAICFLFVLSCGFGFWQLQKNNATH